LDTLRFEPNELTVRAGQPIQLTFVNGGRTLHDFTLGQGVAQPVQAVAEGGQRSTVTFTIERAGTYTFVCAQPGHEAAGMKGSIVAQ
jgi:nitrite reductase (NO-forming)